MAQENIPLSPDRYDKHLCSAIHALDPAMDFDYNPEDDILKINNSPAGIKEAAIRTKATEIKEEYAALAYARKREEEYPTIAELTVALYDTDDKTAIETKRAAVKKKWPKDNSGPVE